MKFLFLSLSFFSTSLFSMDVQENQIENKWKKLSFVNAITLPNHQQKRFFYNRVNKKMYFFLESFKQLACHSVSFPLQEAYSSDPNHLLANVKTIGLMSITDKLFLLALAADKVQAKETALILSIWNSRLEYPSKFISLIIPENKSLNSVEFFKNKDSKSILVAVLATAKDKNENILVRGKLDIAADRFSPVGYWSIYERISNK
jgi:hypothetical protein